MIANADFNTGHVAPFFNSVYRCVEVEGLLKAINFLFS